MDSSRHVSITHADVDTADDAICLKTTSPGHPLEHVTVSDCRWAGTGCNGVPHALAAGMQAAAGSCGPCTAERPAAASNLLLPTLQPLLPPACLFAPCRLRSRSSAVKLGSESVADMRHISFSRLAIADSHRGLAIQLRCGWVLRVKTLGSQHPAAHPEHRVPPPLCPHPLCLQGRRQHHPGSLL